MYYALICVLLSPCSIVGEMSCSRLVYVKFRMNHMQLCMEKSEPAPCFQEIVNLLYLKIILALLGETSGPEQFS